MNKKQKRQLFKENFIDVGDKIIDITLVLMLVVIIGAAIVFLAVKALWFLLTVVGLVVAVFVIAEIKTLIDIHKFTNSSSQRQNKEKKKD
jgi:membrane protein YdbS with pleckstrin-like domain